MKAHKIKILFLIDRLLPGGTENQLISLVENLPHESFEPVIGVLQENEFLTSLNLKTPIVNFKLHGLRIVKSISLIGGLRNYIEHEGFNIVQTQWVDAAIYGAFAVKLIKHRPFLVGTRRDLYHWINEEPMEFRLYRFTARFADRILVNSHSIFAKCQEVEKIPSSKIILIQNSVEIERFNGISKEAAKSKIGLNGHYPVIGVVANWRPVKGLIPFLNAANRVISKFPSAHFVLVGFGEQKNELILNVQKLGIQDNVIFLEQPSNVHEIIQAFDIAVQPSLSESLSNVLLEYMAASRPIVVTRVGDAEKVIEDGHEGLLVRPNNPEELSEAIINLCRNRPKADEMGKRAREKVEANWSSSKILDTYVKFYQELIQPKN